MEDFKGHASEHSVHTQASQNLLADSGAYDQSCKLSTLDKGVRIGTTMGTQAVLEGYFWEKTTGNHYAAAAGVGLGLVEGYNMAVAVNQKKEQDCIDAKKNSH